MRTDEQRQTEPAGSHEDVLLRYSCDEAEASLPSRPSDPHSFSDLTTRHQPDQNLAQSGGSHSGCIPVVHNMTGTCKLGCSVDLERLACLTRNTEYNPNGLPGAIMRLVHPKSVALVFDSGKMVVMGTPTESALRLAARKFAKIILRVGFPVQFQNFKVVNMLATCDTRFPIRIEGVHFKHALCSYYEPEIFPGLVYRMRQPKVTMMIFVSGKVVLVGAKQHSHLSEAFEKLYPSLLEFRKTDVACTSPDDADHDLHALDDDALHHILLQTDPLRPLPPSRSLHPDTNH